MTSATTASRRRRTRRVRSSKLEDDRSVLVNEDSVLEVPGHGAGEHDTLDVAADPLELVHAVAVRHACDVLFDDRACVELLGDVVRGGSDDLHPPVARAAVRAGA